VKKTFQTVIFKDKEKNATGIPVPNDVIIAFNAGKRPKVKVTINDYTYRTTVAVMGGVYMLPYSAENREAAKIKANENVEVTLELDTEPHLVNIPEDLARNLIENNVMDEFESLSYSIRKEYVRQVESAKAQETRDRRILNVISNLLKK